MNANILSPQFLNAAMRAPPERLNAFHHFLETADSSQLDFSRPLLLSVTEASKLLGISRCSVWRAIRAGRLKKIELYPGFERLRRTDVEALAGGAS